MILPTLELLAGAVLALITLRDVVGTVVVPGRTRGPLQVVHRLMGLMLPLWRSLRRPEQGVSTAFAPFILVQAFVTWMASSSSGSA